MFWNPAQLVGFVWADVDHGTDFAPGASRPGDLNCDGAVSFADINPFVALLTGS